MIKIGRKEYWQIAVILLGVGVLFANPRKKGSPPSRPAPARQTAVFGQQSLGPESFYLRLEAQADAIKVQRDPFSKVSLGNQPARRDPVLMGIAYEAENPTAIINDQIVGVGSLVDGYTVLEITPTLVILEKENKKLTLSL